VLAYKPSEDSPGASLHPLPRTVPSASKIQI
jgi:hypothetical protein